MGVWADLARTCADLSVVPIRSTTPDGCRGEPASTVNRIWPTRVWSMRVFARICRHLQPNPYQPLGRGGPVWPPRREATPQPRSCRWYVRPLRHLYRPLRDDTTGASPPMGVGANQARPRKAFPPADLVEPCVRPDLSLLRTPGHPLGICVRLRTLCPPVTTRR
jgi:hypothetical protein